MAHQRVITGGGFQDARGNVLALGSLRVRLKVDTVLSNSQIVAGRTVDLPLDSSGNVAGSPTLWAPANYVITAFSSQGQPVWRSEISIPDGVSSYSLTP